MNKFLYVTGDSFCAQRATHNHWPKILADMFGLELIGQGYPGYGWWPSCQDFVSKYDLNGSMSADSWMNRTPVFIFCHTDIHRPLTGNKSWLDSDGFTSLMDYHLKYVSDPAADNWCAERWYKQIGEVIDRSGSNNKTIIHLNCFDHNQHLRKFLKGKVFETSLLDVSTRSAGADPANLRTKDTLDKINNADNHLCGNYNQRFAQFLYNNIDNNIIDIEL